MRKINFFLFAFLLLACLINTNSIAENNQDSQRGRLIILADMGNEPDEEQQMMHLLMCSNEMDIEGLIAVTGKFLNPNSDNPEKQKLYPELFHHLIDGYSKVHKNLLIHSKDYPSPSYLSSLVRTGQKGYGIDDVGEGKSSPGSELIIQSVLKEDNRPLYIVVNAGSNTLAQALYDLERDHTDEEVEELVAKIRVYENGAQDNTGAWICKNYPDILWIRSNYQTYCYGGPSIDGGFDNKGVRNELGPYTWKPYSYDGIGQHQWLLENVIGNHGPFGNYYPIRQFKGGGISFMEGGGTIPWLCLVNKGLSDINNPHWGGWSGRFTKEKVENVWSKHQSVKVDEKENSPFFLITEDADTWHDEIEDRTYEKSLFAPVWRWRRDFLNDFVCRMDWCTKSYEEANHHPIAVVNEDPSDKIIIVNAQAGEKLKFDGSKSYDPDQNPLKYKWWIYNEAGTYDKMIKLNNFESPQIEFDIPDDAGAKEIHLIFEITDINEIAPLKDYRRIVISVN